MPNISESDEDKDDEWLPTSKSTSKSKRTRRVIFSISSGDSDDNVVPLVKISQVNRSAVFVLV